MLSDTIDFCIENIQHDRWSIIGESLNILESSYKTGNHMLSEIKTNKTKLLNTLKINLDNHIKIYNEALDGYKQKVKETLAKKLEQANSGGDVDTSILLNKPVSHEKEYKEAIEMLAWNDEENITLDNGHFRQYVLDEWSWSRNFFTSNAIYSGMAASGCSTKGY